MRHSLLLNYALYQIGWFACVWGGATDHPWTGCLLAMALVAAHLMLARERQIELRLVLTTMAVGVVVEMIQIAMGTYRFTAGTLIDILPPPWLLAMWAQFATTFRFSLRHVMSRPMSAALFGAAGGPIAFIAGERLGAVTLLPPVGFGLLRLSICWAVAGVVLSAIVRRLSPAADARGYRALRDAG